MTGVGNFFRDLTPLSCLNISRNLCYKSTIKVLRCTGGDNGQSRLSQQPWKRHCFPDALTVGLSNFRKDTRGITVMATVVEKDRTSITVREEEV
jgi:hypothetical protein